MVYVVVGVLYFFDDMFNDLQLLVEQVSLLIQLLDLVMLYVDDSNWVVVVIGQLFGVVIILQVELFLIDKYFVLVVFNDVKKVVVDEFDGKVGWWVVSVN